MAEIYGDGDEPRHQCDLAYRYHLERRYAYLNNCQPRDAVDCNKEERPTPAMTNSDKAGTDVGDNTNIDAGSTKLEVDADEELFDLSTWTDEKITSDWDVL